MREKQIEEVRKDIFAALGGYAKWEEDWQSLAEALYNAGYRKQEWISVDERLPDRDTQALVVYGDGYMMLDYMPFDDGVTHWMPLPEPPKKGGSDTKVEITFELHKEKGTNLLLVDFQDVFKFIGEGTKKEVELGFYLEKWCEWLNYYFTHSSTANGNIDESQLRCWIDGYNYAKHIDEQEFCDRYVLSMRGYLITLYKPFAI